MFVCEHCHDRDINATRCNYTFKIHTTLIRKEAIKVRPCEICGKTADCLFCADYHFEATTRAQIKRYAEIQKEQAERINNGHMREMS